VARGRRRRPAVSSIGVLRNAAGKFCPPYEVEHVDAGGLRIKLRDPSGRRPDLRLRHRHERRLFLKANYLVVESSVSGEGPAQDGELTFRFRGPLRRQRAVLRWRRPVEDGDRWARRLQEPLLRGLRDVEAIQSLVIGWTASTGAWQLRLETISGAMLGGMMSPLPIPVPLDPQEAVGIIAMIDALDATGA
jgi:hypothetical protein